MCDVQRSEVGRLHADEEAKNSNSAVEVGAQSAAAASISDEVAEKTLRVAH